MKLCKLLVSVSLLLIVLAPMAWMETVIPIDEAHFPDDVFRMYVRENDENNNGLLEEEENLFCFSFDGTKDTIKSLQGIQYCKYYEISLENLTLTEGIVLNNFCGGFTYGLFFKNCSFPYINVAGSNINRIWGYDSKISEFYASNCKELGSGNDYLYLGDCEIEYLDLSGCTSLKGFHSANSSMIQKLKMRGCKEFKQKLYFWHGLEYLDIGECSSLEDVRCLDAVTFLADKCTSLKTVHVEGSNRIDIAGCTALEELYCFPGSLDVSTCTALKVLSTNGSDYIYEGTPEGRLTVLDVRNCKQLTRLNVKDNKLKELFVNDLDNLRFLDCSGNDLESLNVEGCNLLMDLNCSGNQILSLDMNNHVELENLYCQNNLLQFLNITGCVGLKILDCCKNELKELTFADSSEIVTVYCSDNQLTELDLSDHVHLKTVRCANNCISYANLSGCISYDEMFLMGSFGGNPMELDLSNCSSLTNIITWNGDDWTQLCSLNVSGCTSLERIEVLNYDASLRQIIARDCSALTDLIYYGKNMINIDVSNCLVLSSLRCSGNNLEDLEIAECMALTYLEIGDNQLTALDLKGCKALKELYCYNNQVSDLDLSYCSDLEILMCDNNQLTSLVVSVCPALKRLSCSNNQLTSLDLTKCNDLCDFYCYDCGKYLEENNRTFDLSQLEGFEVTLASNWQSGTVEDTILTFDYYRVTYDYDCGRGFNCSFFLEKAPSFQLFSGGLNDNNTPEGPEIDHLVNTFGTFTWEGAEDGEKPKDDDYSTLTLGIPLTNDTDELMEGVCYIGLPDSFSFSPYMVENVSPLEYEIAPGETEIYYVPFHPLYSETLTGENGAKLYITLSIDESFTEIFGNCEFLIAANVHRGKILMRPTRAITSLKGGILDENEEAWLEEPEALEEWLDNSTFRPRDFINADTETYSDNMSLLGCMLSQSVYNYDKYEMKFEDNYYLEKSLHDLGFTDVEFKQNRSPYGSAVGFARKKVVEDGQVYNVGVVVVRGTVDDEWVGNFDVVGRDNSVHNNFNDCYKDVKKHFDTYVKEMKKIEPDFVFDKVFICGHSRGGAIANLFAHDLTMTMGAENVFAYTFAAPNCTQSPSADPNIFNYCYAYDFVPFVPQKYGKHGISMVVGGINASAAPKEVKAAFYDYTGGSNYIVVGSGIVRDTIIMNAGDANSTLTQFHALIGLFIADPDGYQPKWIAKAHGVENYLSWVMQNGNKDWVPMDEIIQKKNKWYGDWAATWLNTNFVHPVTWYFEMGLWYQSLKDLLEAHSVDELDPMNKFLLKTPDLVDLYFKTPNRAVDREKFMTYIFQCPVDISVKNSRGVTAAEVKNHQLMSLDGSVIALGDGEMTFMCIPIDEDYHIEVVGNADGTMKINGLRTNGTDSFEAAFEIPDITVTLGGQFHMTPMFAPYKLIGDDGTIYDPHAATRILTMRLPKELKAIEEGAFEGIDAEMVVIPKDCETIGARAFANSPKLIYVVFESAETELAEDAFVDCSDNLTIVGHMWIVK